MANLADIIQGAVAGSQSVRVRLNSADGATVLVFRGNLQLGSGVVANGLSDVVLSLPLVTGDVVQASVTERGNQAGLPITVKKASVRVTGWKTPTEIEVIDEETGDRLNIPADQFRQLYGFLPASIYDPSGSRAVVYPEYEPQPLGAIQFSLLVRQEPGQTYVFVQNVTGIRGTVLVRWASGETFGSDASRVFTTSATVNLEVKGSNDTSPATRTITVTVLAASVTPVVSDILGVCYRFNNGPFVRVLANSVKQLETRLLELGTTWTQMNIEESQYQECFFNPVPNGAYTIQVRVAGDTDTSRWRSLTITKS